MMCTSEQSQDLEQSEDVPLTVIYVCSHCRGNTTDPEVIEESPRSTLRYGLLVCRPCAKQLRKGKRP